MQKSLVEMEAAVVGVDEQRPAAEQRQRREGDEPPRRAEPAGAP
jgi:hypothetical protein